MSQDSKHSRKLREMFRMFQRQKKDDDIDEKVEEKATNSRKRSSHSLSEGRLKDYRKKLATWMAEPAYFTTVEDNEAANATAKSPAEIKREFIRMKYGLREKDQEFYRKAKDDIEEFESVNAVSRPATTKMRTAKLRWKDKDMKDSYLMACGHDKASNQRLLTDTSDDMIEDMVDGDIHCDTRVADIKRRVIINRNDGTEKNNEFLNEMRILLTRIEDLELLNRRLVLEIRRLKKVLAFKEKKLEEMSAYMSSVKKSAIEEPEEKLTAEQEAVAIRVLEIMKRNQLLEHSIGNSERTILSKFFEAVDPKPTPSIVVIIDKAFTYAIDVLLMKPDKFDDFVDNVLREFLLDTLKAKRILLDVMLLHPEYVPRTWGGDVMVKRLREVRPSATEKQAITGAGKANAPFTRFQEYDASNAAYDEMNDAKLRHGMNTATKSRPKNSLSPIKEQSVAYGKTDSKPTVSMEKSGLKEFRTISNKNGKGNVNEVVMANNQSTSTMNKTHEISRSANILPEKGCANDIALTRAKTRLRATGKSMGKHHENLTNGPAVMTNGRKATEKSSTSPNTMIKMSPNANIQSPQNWK